MAQVNKRSTLCGHCHRSFAYIYDLERLPVGSTSYPLSCPFCETRQHVPLQSERKVVVLKDGTQQEKLELTLPEHPVGNVED